MKKLFCLLLCLCALCSLSLPVCAAESENEFENIRGQFSPMGRVSPENSIIRTSILFQNVERNRVCTLRWYIDDVLYHEDPAFLLTPGAEAFLEVSLHFDNSTGSSAVLWAELTDNDGAGHRAVFAQTLLTRSIRSFPDPDGDDYIIHVIRNQCVVIVYERLPDGEPGRIVNVFTCSPGLNNWTITGRYTATSREEWLRLMGGVSGHYATLIWGDYLFHSVPYYSGENHRLKTEEYNKLGQPASSGCIRLAVSDAKWIYDNCKSGTKVYLFDSDTLPVVKPIPIRINPDSPNAGWDPTDPHPDNPTRSDWIPPVFPTDPEPYIPPARSFFLYRIM